MQAKTLFLLLFLSIIHVCVFAQKDTTYYNARGVKVAPSLATTYLIRTKSQNSQAETYEEYDASFKYKKRFYVLKKMPQTTMAEVVVTGYQVNSNGQRLAFDKEPDIFTPIDSVMLKQGIYMEWYPSGTLKTKGSYFAGKLNGSLETYYENGKSKQVETYHLDTLKTGHSFDSLGVEVAHSPYFELPKFPKGESEMFKFLCYTIKYPPTARRDGIQERIFVSFTVEKDGKITTIQPRNGQTKDLKTECIRTISVMPKWTPARMDGENVATTFVLPVKFILE
jgi:TonB family protein